MTHDIEIFETQLTFNDNDWILLTDENKEIIGRQLEQQGYTWSSGDTIRNSISFKAGRLLRIYETNKTITWSTYFINKKILNYKFIKIDI